MAMDVLLTFGLLVVVSLKCHPDNDHGINLIQVFKLCSKLAWVKALKYLNPYHRKGMISLSFALNTIQSHVVSQMNCYSITFVKLVFDFIFIIIYFFYFNFYFFPNFNQVALMEDDAKYVKNIETEVRRSFRKKTSA